MFPLHNGPELGCEDGILYVFMPDHDYGKPLEVPSLFDWSGEQFEALSRGYLQPVLLFLV